MGAARTRVVVGRKWNYPEIYTHVCDEKIELAISLENFILALISEAKSPALIMSRSGLNAQLLAAIPKVLAEVKKASVQAV